MLGDIIKGNKMKKKISFIETAKGLTNIAQLGLSVIAPIIIFVFLGVYLKDKFNIPDLLVLFLILIGIASGVTSFVNFIRSYLKEIDSKKKK